MMICGVAGGVVWCVAWRAAWGVLGTVAGESWECPGGKGKLARRVMVMVVASSLVRRTVVVRDTANGTCSG